MQLALFNYILMAAFTFGMTELTKRNHMKSCVFLGVIMAEYVAMAGDYGMVIEFIIAMAIYVNFKGMIKTSVFQLISIFR